MLSCFTSLASTFHCLASCRMKIGLLGCVCLRRSYPSTIVLQTPSLLQTGTRSTQSSSSSNPCARCRRMVQREGRHSFTCSELPEQEIELQEQKMP